MKPLGGGMRRSARLAFKYLLQFPQVVSIPGIERIEEIEEILQIVSDAAHLTQTDLDEMERIRQELGDRFCRHR